MRTSSGGDDPELDTEESVRRLGFLAAVCISVTTAAAFGMAMIAIPIAGPHCPGPCVTYPFTDELVAEHFPRDYLWMYPAMLTGLLVVALAACLHRLAPESRKVFGLIGLSLSTVAATVLLIDYFVQVTVLQPNLVKGQTDGWAMLTQYNPNGVFIALEELGYLVMSAALLCLSALVTGATRIDRVIRWLFAGGFAVVAGAFVLLSALYGLDRQDRFEVPAITAVWSVLIAAGVLLAVRLRRGSRL